MTEMVIYVVQCVITCKINAMDDGDSVYLL